MGFSYRDSKSGRYASKATWKRSKSRGGKRYKREKNKGGTKKKDGKKAVEKTLTKLNLPKDGTFHDAKNGEGTYQAGGKFTPPDFVSITIFNPDKGTKTITVKVKFNPDTDDWDFVDNSWETDDTDY